MKKRNKRRRRRMTLLIYCGVLIVGGSLTGLAAAVSRLAVHPVPPPTTQGPWETAVPTLGQTITIPPVPAPVAKPGAKSQPQPTVAYDYSQPVPQSAAAPEGYFSDALFLGNSITDGISRFGVIPEATVYAKNGLTVTDALTDAVVSLGGGKRISVGEALGKKQFGKVYLMFGMNELGWSSESEFLRRYGKVIDSIWQAQPNAVIYVQSVLPVTAEKSATSPIFTNEKVLRFNELLRQLCQEKQALYLDAHSALVNEAGALPAEISPDGVHINKDSYSLWYDYISTHIWKGAAQ